MPSIVYVKAASNRRAFKTPHGPEISNVVFEPTVYTQFVRNQIEDGDLIVKPDEKIQPVAEHEPAEQETKEQKSIISKKSSSDKEG